MILLYNPPSSARRKPVLPMSLLALGALLEGEHEYRIVDGNLERDPQCRAGKGDRRDGRGHPGGDGDAGAAAQPRRAALPPA